jgi:tetratricopeptide (TPR) repeat protein
LAIVDRGFGGAKPIIASLCEIHANDASLYAFHALSLMWTGDYEGTDVVLNPWLEGSPSASILAVLAEIQLIRGQKDLAKASAAQAREQNPDDYLYLRTAYSLATVDKEFPTARAILRRSMELYPTDPDVFGSETTLLQAAGRLEELQTHLDESPQWFKGTAQYHACRGRLSFSRHDLPKMEMEFQQAVAMCPESSSYWGYLALSQMHQSKFPEAERSAQFAVEINPKNPLALRALSKACAARGDKAAAADFEKRASEAIPAMKTSAKGFAAGELLGRGDVNGALRVLREQAASDSGIGAASAKRMILGLLIQHRRWAERPGHNWTSWLVRVRNIPALN